MTVSYLEDSIGEIYMLAVDSDHQGGGLGTALTEFALARIKDAGMAVAMVERGATPGTPHVRKGRLRPPADSQVLQEPVTTRGSNTPANFP